MFICKPSDCWFEPCCSLLIFLFCVLSCFLLNMFSFHISSISSGLCCCSIILPVFWSATVFRFHDLLIVPQVFSYSISIPLFCCCCVFHSFKFQCSSFYCVPFKIILFLIVLKILWLLKSGNAIAGSILLGRLFQSQIT